MTDRFAVIEQPVAVRVGQLPEVRRHRNIQAVVGVQHAAGDIARDVVVEPFERRLGDVGEADAGRITQAIDALLRHREIAPVVRAVAVVVGQPRVRRTAIGRQLAAQEVVEVVDGSSACGRRQTTPDGRECRAAGRSGSCSSRRPCRRRRCRARSDRRRVPKAPRVSARGLAASPQTRSAALPGRAARRRPGSGERSGARSGERRSAAALRIAPRDERRRDTRRSRARVSRQSSESLHFPSSKFELRSSKFRSLVSQRPVLYTRSPGRAGVRS